MMESLSGYGIPTSQMEDVPICNQYDENSTKSKPEYVKPKGKHGRCSGLKNHWDFFMYYKTTFFIAIVLILLLLFLSISIIYIAWNSADGSSTLNIDTLIQEESVTKTKLLQIDNTNRHLPTRNRLEYKTLPNLNKRETRKIRKRDIQLAKGKKILERAETGRFPREVEILSVNHYVSKRSNINNYVAKRSNKRRQVDAINIPCKRNAEYCKALLTKMKSSVTKTGKSVYNINDFVQHGSNPQEIEDVLQCAKLMNIDDIPVFSSSRHAAPPYSKPSNIFANDAQIKTMSAISALLDSNDTKRDTKKDTETRKETNTTVIQHQNNRSYLEPWLSNSNTKNFHPDFVKIPQKKIRQTLSSLDNVPQSEVTTTDYVSGPTGPSVISHSFRFPSSSGWGENMNSNSISEKKPLQDNLVMSPLEQHHPLWNRGNEPQRVFEPTNFESKMRNQEVKTPNYNPNSITQTVETTKASQYVDYSPPLFYAPFQLCSNGSGMSLLPVSPNGQSMTGMMASPISTGVANNPFAANQFPTRGFVDQTMNQGFSPMQISQQQGGQFQMGQQFNAPWAFQQSQIIGPTGPGGNQLFTNVPSSSGPARTPFCISAAMFQFPMNMMPPGYSGSARAAVQPEEVVDKAEKQYSVTNKTSIAGTNQPGHDDGCKQNSQRCLDGSHCVSKSLWCDGRVDCPDASDETKCPCHERISKGRICDGYFDCPRGEDELGCFGCPEHTFSCEYETMNNRETCLPITQRCDGLRQCRNGKDESECTILTESYAQNQDILTVGYTAGFLHKNWQGQWYPVCTPSKSWATEACVLEIGSELSEQPNIQIESMTPGEYQGLYLSQTQRGEITVISSCSNKVIFVRCPSLTCGTTVVKDQDNFISNNLFGDTLVGSSQNSTAKQNEPSTNVDGKIVSEMQEVPMEKAPLMVDSTDTEIKNENMSEFVGSQFRIVGGRASRPRAWPFLIAIYKDGNFHCGGLIIDKDWVLTAAHCLVGFGFHYWEIQAGLLRRLSFTPTGQARRAKYVKMHSAFDEKTMQNDIAMIKVDEPFRFNRWIRPTCLPLPESNGSDVATPNTTCVAVGWGSTAEESPAADHLREVELLILPQCPIPIDRQNGAICAGFPEGGRDACQGDSGGPLMCKHPKLENQWFAAGIVSHGEGCARRDEPGVYTRVSRFVNWIDDTKRNEDDVLTGRKPLTICPGFSCQGGLGKCLPKNKRCDGTVNCLGAEDETDCPIFSKAPSFRGSTSTNNKERWDDLDSDMVAQKTPDYLNKNETKEIENVPDVLVTNATTSKAIAKQPDFTMERNENSSFDSIIEVTPITTLSQTTQKTVTVATSGSDSSSELPISATSEPETSSLPSDVPVRFICTKLMQTIPISKRCNGIYDCEDGTDEDNCTCKDNLANIYPVGVCDGFVDCDDGSDEENCTHCEEDEFLCSRSGKCVSKLKLCDYSADCPYMEDELDCFTLSNGDHVNIDMDGRPQLNQEGVVTKWKNNEWRPICQTLNATMQEQVSNGFCAYFDFRAAANFEEILVEDSPIQFEKSNKSRKIPYEYPPSYEIPDNSTKTCRGLYVECRPVLSANTSHLIVSNPKTENTSYLWPWQAFIFVDGRHHCPAIILEHDWLLASSKCVQNIDLENNYTVALVGAAPAYLHAKGPYEQLIPIDSLKNLEKLDAVLMHLKNSINATRYIQPLFVQKKIFPAAQNDVCVATGVDDKFEPKTTFLQTVPHQCPQCHRCYINIESEDCRKNNTSTNWSGIIVCRGSETWYPAAIFHEKDLLCGFQSKQTLTSIDYGNAQFTETMEEHVIFPTTPPPCDGFRCSLGECLSLDKVCDGIPDCRGGYDEDANNCEKLKEACDNSIAGVPKIGCKCTKSELRCGNGQCVPKEVFCDFKVDCDDRTDETERCTCADYLQLTAPERLCDNVRHCLDKTDESHEICHCKDANFKCSSNGNFKETCISQDFVCDGEDDCPNGDDESAKNCRTVKGTLKDPPGVGEVLRRSFGAWHSECFPSPITSAWEISDLCKSMGYNYGEKLEFENGENPYGPPLFPERDDFYMVRLNNQTWISMRTDKPLINLVPAKEPCHRAFVRCM